MQARQLFNILRAVACLAFAGAALAQGTPPAKAPDRLARVLAARELRVCIWPDYYGITWRNPKTEELSGIDIDISRDLARDLGVTVRYVDSSFSALIDNLIGDRCDVAMHAVGVTPQRQARLAFSRPYLSSDIYAIVPKSSRAIRDWADLDKPGRVIAVQAGTVMEPVMKQSLKQAQLMSVKPPATREQEVESGRADAFMTDYPYSRRMLDLTDWARLVSPPQPFHVTDYAYAFAPGDASLLDRVNQYLVTARRDGRLREFAARHKLDPILATP